MKIVDFHSHILPGVDDGSHSVEQSLEMLSLMKQQGVSQVCATPHFYPTHSTPDRFFEKRSAAYSTLVDSLPEGMPEILLGAEFRYFPGMGHMSNLKDFCLQGTNILLLEMPFQNWTEHNLREVRELADYGNVTVMLAHYERYSGMATMQDLDMLKSHGVLIQSNAENFLGFFSGISAVKLLKNGFIDVLGSDAHNTDSRRPNLGGAYEKISKKLGQAFAAELADFGFDVIERSRE